MRASVRHLEELARQGWQLEHTGSVFWTYRRCEPAELHYAVVYFPKASQFDPEPPPEQRDFWALCKATGWELVSNRYQMQVFCNPAEEPNAHRNRPGGTGGKRPCRHESRGRPLQLAHAVLCAASDLGAIPKCGNNSGSAVIRNLPSGRFALGIDFDGFRCRADRLLPLEQTGGGWPPGRRGFSSLPAATNGEESLSFR